jgi:PB1 domain
VSSLLISGAYFITIRYRPEESSEVPIILRPRSEEIMLKWYNSLLELHRKCVEVDGELQIDYQRQTQLYSRDKSMSVANGSGRYTSKFDGRIDVTSPLTPTGSGSEDGQDDGLRSLPMLRTASSGNISDRSDGYQIPRKPAPSRFPLNPHGPPPHARSGSLGVATDFQGSYFSPMVDTPPVPPLNSHSSQQYGQQYPFPSQRGDDLSMSRTLSKDGYANGIPTPPLTAKLPERTSRPSIAPLNTSRSRSASTPNIHQIQTNVSKGRELPPPLPVGRHDRDSGSPITPHSPSSPMTSSRPTTGTSTFTNAFSSIPETPSSTSSSTSSATRKPVPSTPTSANFDKTSALKVKITYGNDMFVVVVPTDVTYSALLQKVRHKLTVCSNVARDGPLRMKYQDEDGDLVTISSDEDVALAIETRTQPHNIASAGFAGAGVINLLVYSSSI